MRRWRASSRRRSELRAECTERDSSIVSDIMGVPPRLGAARRSLAVSGIASFAAAPRFFAVPRWRAQLSSTGEERQDGLVEGRRVVLVHDVRGFRDLDPLSPWQQLLEPVDQAME